MKQRDSLLLLLLDFLCSDALILSLDTGYDLPVCFAEAILDSATELFVMVAFGLWDKFFQILKLIARRNLPKK